MNKKICFVAMGFGKKMDYRNSREVDLDIIYKHVIKTLVSSELKEYELIRADEIRSSELIDVSMYTLLLKADLVIADITTMNENAIYELGIRHALKPFSTIIMMQESEKTVIPFDINHCRILTYKEIGDSLDPYEISVIKERLKNFVKVSEDQKPDSPLYTYLPEIKPPTLSDEEFDGLIKSIKKNEETISKMVEKAEELKNNSKFKESSTEWKRLQEILPNNDYIIQQLALVQYKSKHPIETRQTHE
jgi:hypothetical protein